MALVKTDFPASTMLNSEQGRRYVHICIYIYIYTGCPRRKGPNFWRVFLRSNYTDI